MPRCFCAAGPLDKPIIAGHGASLLSFPQPEQQSPGGSRLRADDKKSLDFTAILERLKNCEPNSSLARSRYGKVRSMLERQKFGYISLLKRCERSDPI